MIKNDYGFKGKPTTIRDPQANAIVERVHQVIGNIIQTFELETNDLDEDDPWKGILSATAFAVRSTFHTTLQKSPAGQLVFGRDMIFNIQHTANWEYIKQRKQQIIDITITDEKMQLEKNTSIVWVTRFSSDEEQKTIMRLLSKVLTKYYTLMIMAQYA